MLGVLFRVFQQLFSQLLVFLVVSLACSFSIPNFASRARVPTPESTLGLIAFVGSDGNIYTTDREGKQQFAITQDAVPDSSGGQSLRLDMLPWKGSTLLYVLLFGGLFLLYATYLARYPQEFGESAEGCWRRSKSPLRRLG